MVQKAYLLNSKNIENMPSYKNVYMAYTLHISNLQERNSDKGIDEKNG